MYIYIIYVYYYNTLSICTQVYVHVCMCTPVVKFEVYMIIHLHVVIISILFYSYPPFYRSYNSQKLYCKSAIQCIFLHSEKGFVQKVNTHFVLRPNKQHSQFLRHVASFYGPQGHPYDCFPTGSMYVYIFIFLCHLHEYALYTQLRKFHHSRGLSQLMGVAHNRMHA